MLGTRRFFRKKWLFSGFKQSLFPNENKPVTSKKPKSQKKKEKLVKIRENMASNTTLAIRSLLLKGWRERWSDIQWGIHLKEVLPRHSEPKFRILFGNCWGKIKTCLCKVHVL